MCPMCTPTVRSLMNSFWPISRFVRPSATAARTSYSRAVSAASSSPAAGTAGGAAASSPSAIRARVALAGDEDVVTPIPQQPGDELSMLTDREREVLAAVAEGLTNREIGQKLFISERTVGVHIGHIFDKLQVRTRVQASRVYLRAA